MNERPSPQQQAALSQDVQFEPRVIENRQRRQQLVERKRRDQREQSQSKRGRSFSLMDRFRENAMNLDGALDDGDDVEIVDDSEEERRLMVLNQSGFNREAAAIERERTRKRRATRQRLADHAKRY